MVIVSYLGYGFILIYFHHHRWVWVRWGTRIRRRTVKSCTNKTRGMWPFSFFIIFAVYIYSAVPYWHVTPREAVRISTVPDMALKTLFFVLAYHARLACCEALKMAINRVSDGVLGCFGILRTLYSM